ncbi:MAG: hypothetical protein ACLQVF_26575 [Isosphaeraceae bacterium]
MVTSLYTLFVQSVLGGLTALAHQFVAAYGWPGLAALVAAGYVVVQALKSAKPALKFAAVAGIAVLAAWWFWPSRTTGSVPHPPVPAAAPARPGLSALASANAHAPASSLPGPTAGPAKHDYSREIRIRRLIRTGRYYQHTY